MWTKKLWLAQVVVLLAVRAGAQNTFPANGNVGIGTTSPDSLLEVGNPNIGNSFHSMVGGGYAGLFENIYTGYGGNAILLWAKSVNQNPGTYHLFVEGNNNPELVVQGNGNVGIGTSAPETQLVVASGYVSGDNQVYNALTVRPGSGSGGYGGNGASIFLGSRTNHGVDPVAGIWSALGNGGDSGVNYSGDLVLGTTIQGSATPVEAARIDGNGNFGIGTKSPGAKLEVKGNVKLSGGGSITFPDGSNQSVAWNGTLCGGDYAETVNASGDRQRYEPGDVLVLSEHSGSDVSKSSQPYSTLVSGIYSTKPGVVGRRQTGEKSDTEIPMAMIGIVPTKISAENGPIKRGDLLVTSSTYGHAMKGTDQSRMLGAIVGKALGSLDSGTGVIEVLVSLQ